MSSLEDEKVKQTSSTLLAMALNQLLFNSSALTINTSPFFLPSSFPWLISSDFNLFRTNKQHSASGIIFSLKFFAL